MRLNGIFKVGRFSLLGFFVCLLTACGGGGSGDGSKDSPNTESGAPNTETDVPANGGDRKSLAQRIEEVEIPDETQSFIDSNFDEFNSPRKLMQHQIFLSELDRSEAGEYFISLYAAEKCFRRNLSPDEYIDKKADLLATAFSTPEQIEAWIRNQSKLNYLAIELADLPEFLDCEGR